MFFIYFLHFLFAENSKSEIVELSGAGSSFPSAMYQEIGGIYSANRMLTRQISFTYDRVNSVYGKERILMKSLNLAPIVFAGSETRLTDNEKITNPEMFTFPTVAGALAIIFKLPKIKRLNLTVTTIAEIFSGKIQYWNDPAIQSVNFGLQMPPQRIFVVARSDSGAGDTLIFTSALSRISQEWHDKFGVFADPEFTDAGECCNSTKWPRDVVKFFGNRVTGLVGIVASVPYTIGYAATANTVGTDVAYVTVVNALGNAVDISANSVQAAMNYYQNMYKEINKVNNGLEYDINNALDPNAYPFASFSYMIINKTTHPKITCYQMQELTGFVDWLFQNQTTSIMDKYGLVHLSDKVINYVKENILSEITCGGKSSYQSYKETLINKKSLSSIETTTVIICVLFGTAILITILIFYYKRQKIITDNQWMIRDVQLVITAFSGSVDNGSLKLNRIFSNSSIGLVSHLSSNPDNNSESSALISTRTSRFLMGKWAQIGDYVLLTKFQPRNLSLHFDVKSKVLLNKYHKAIRHSNLMSFFGITRVDNEIYLVNQFLYFKGTLHHVLDTSPYNLDMNIKRSFAGDVLEGLRYLHDRHVAHGKLTSLECYVDYTWRVKIVRWELNELVENSILSALDIKSTDNLISMLYLDPEYSHRHPIRSTPFQSDLYSYGVLLIEIFTRKLPYHNDVELALTSYQTVIEDKFQAINFSPDISSAEDSQPVQHVIQKLMSPLAKRQADIPLVYKQIREVIPAVKSVVDTLMHSMENYMNELEEKVVERTAELTQMTNRMKDLLNNVLPPQIATKLFRGEIVEPEFYECCTIFFSDIVGFTTISARSTPTEVMAFLNSVYTLFDKIILTFDVYKVDTIGDAYMVASGIPIRNGINHCKNIGLLALAVINTMKNFEIIHIPGEKVNIRVGINSGPVTAGIIGQKMPQYCVFGDTVNTASRMESTSLPGCIQVSEITYKLFEQYFPEFHFQERGEIEVKGKGTMKSYWLMSCKVTMN